MEAAALALLLAIPRKQKPLNLQQADALLFRTEHELAEAIAAVRQKSRQIGLLAAEHELRVHGMNASLERTGAAGTIKDLTRGQRFARRYVELWRGKFTKALESTTRQAATIATKQAEHRLESIAVTETFKAFNEERRNALADVRLPHNVEIVEIWDAQMDACPACWERDGEETPAGESFHGDNPGDMHPNCRCTSHFVTRYR